MVMLINYRSLDGRTSDSDLGKHAEWLARDWDGGVMPGRIGTHGTVDVLPGYTTVDVLGQEFVWMNNTFTRDKFTWYLWFESVFLVPETMLPFLQLRWGQ